MKKLYFVLLHLVITLANAQSASPDVLSSAGNILSSSTMQVSWTLGEPINSSLSNNNTLLTQGFQQSNVSVVGIERLDPNIEINVYPNPLTDYLIVQQSGNLANCQIVLFDVLGNILHSEPLVLDHLEIDFTGYSPGVYYINFNSPNGSIIQKFTLQKIN